MSRAVAAVLLLACGAPIRSAPASARVVEPAPVATAAATPPPPEPEPAPAPDEDAVTCAKLPPRVTSGLPAGKVVAYDANVQAAKRIYASLAVEPKPGADVTTTGARIAWLRTCFREWYTWREEGLRAGDERVEAAGRGTERASMVFAAKLWSAEAWTAFAHAALQAAAAAEPIARRRGDQPSFVDATRVGLRRPLADATGWVLEVCANASLDPSERRRCDALLPAVDDVLRRDVSPSR
ncbi:MAG: hypothetical protein KIT84_36840 [Labilithrix sp.]|nr:hypothetical protein [Labilithrix sp.]MCW5816624.1 hypothetical protein [Labilithrix sp.]